MVADSVLDLSGSRRLCGDIQRDADEHLGGGPTSTGDSQRLGGPPRLPFRSSQPSGTWMTASVRRGLVWPTDGTVRLAGMGYSVVR